MINAEYIGPIDHLKGQTALIILKGEFIEAQFDNAELSLDGSAVNFCTGYFPVNALGFNWHQFSVSDFRIDNSDQEPQCSSPPSPSC
jgi:hypothetical protein